MTVQRLRSIGCAACLLIVLAACGNDDRVDSPAGATTTPVPSSELAPTLTVPGTSDGANVVYTTTFEDDASKLFYVGETSFGAQASITDGKYVVEVADGDWQTITPGPMPHPHNGVVEADVMLDGEGFAGLVARSSKDDTGGDWMYVCLIDNTGWAGCVATRGSEYDDLFWKAVDGYQEGDSQRMRLTVVDDRIELQVNDQIIGHAQDTTVTSGAWGVYAESQSEAMTIVSFDNFSISIQPSPADPTSTPASSSAFLERRHAT